MAALKRVVEGDLFDVRFEVLFFFLFLPLFWLPGKRPPIRTNHPTATLTCQSRLPGNAPEVLWHRELAGPNTL